MDVSENRAINIAAAVNSLDDANDAHWTKAGLPDMKAVEAAFGDSTPTRAEVNEVGRVRATSAPSTAPADAPADDPDAQAGSGDGTIPAPPPGDAPKAETVPVITAGRVVFLALADPLDGESVVVGIAVKINDDGSINARAFAPNGGADRTYTGVRPTEYVASMTDGADKNAALSATWSFPPRM